MMARRIVGPSILSILCLWLVCPGVAFAQLGDNIRTASNVGPFMDQINRFVRERAAALGSADPAAQSAARNELAAQVSAPIILSPAFLNAYAGAVNDELLKLLKSEDPRVRLNVAIVSARVAEGAGNARLQPLTLALLNDPSDAVLWWGLRSARAILPHSLAPAGNANAPNNPLITAVVQVGQTRANVIQQVYEALAIEQASIPAPQRSRVLSVTIPALHTVLRGRVDQYIHTVPPDITAEVRATTYLTAKDQYEAQPVNDKLTTTQLVSDLLGVAEQRAADLNPEQRRDMVMMLRNVGGAMVVIGQWENNGPLQAAARSVSQLPLNANAQDIQNAVRPVYNAARGVPRFAKLTPPPKVGQMTNDPGAPPTTTQGAGVGR